MYNRYDHRIPIDADIHYNTRRCVFEMNHHNHHRQTSVVHPTTGVSVSVDAALVSVMQQLWSHGYGTISSCQQDDDGLIRIEFEQGSFNNLLQRAHACSISQTRYKMSLASFLSIECTMMSTWCDNGNHDMHGCWVPGDEISFGTSLRLKPKKLQTFVRLFRRCHD
jgi:hypothetical protein